MKGDPKNGRTGQTGTGQTNIGQTSSDETAAFIREALYRGPVYRKLYALRERRPDLCYELDELARALKQTGDRIEALVRDRLAEQHDL